MRCTYKKQHSQFAFYLANKIIHRLVTGLHLDISGIEKIRELNKNRKTRVILMPMYKSYGDAILQYYINFKSEFDQGFMFGVDEDQP